MSEHNAVLAGLPPTSERWQPTKVARDYDRERFSSLPGRVFNALNQRAIGRAIDAIGRRPRRLLDIPCGTGRATRVALVKADEVVGADISNAMLEEAGRRLGEPQRLRLELADIAQQPFADASFDCVTCIRLMMHLDADQRRAALREMARVTRRYLVVEYGAMSVWLRLRRVLKSAWLRIARRSIMNVRAIAWSDIRTDLAVANLRLAGTFHTARGLSESVILLLEKTERAGD